jgi:ElaB/YqjD/DUF883 family membrane-anchored ribosome-binding protein
MIEEAMAQEKAEGAECRSPREARAEVAGDEANGSAAAFEQASAALSGLRSAIDQASHTLRELSRAGEKWAKDAEQRAIEIGKGLRGHGERAVGGVARQVEQNPLASLAIAFAVGFLCAILARRDNH